MNKYTNEVQRKARQDWEDERAAGGVRTGIKILLIAAVLVVLWVLGEL